VPRAIRKRGSRRREGCEGGRSAGKRALRRLRTSWGGTCGLQHRSDELSSSHASPPSASGTPLPRRVTRGWGGRHQRGGCAALGKLMGLSRATPSMPDPTIGTDSGRRWERRRWKAATARRAAYSYRCRCPGTVRVSRRAVARRVAIQTLRPQKKRFDARAGNSVVVITFRNHLGCCWGPRALPFPSLPI
jgi:hypothetical protein